jgi:transcriptional regulator with XRE-family HTH domain
MMSDDVDLHLGRRLYRRRRLLGMTQAQVAVRVGVRFQQIQKYECGASTIAAARIWQLAEALEVPVSYFFDGLSADQAAAGRGRSAIPETSAAGHQETVDLVEAYYRLDQGPRRGFLALAKSLHADAAAA